MRDRVVMIGEQAYATDVDSVDEVLFMIERKRALAEPLSEDPDLAWHAYAVEYGARVRDRRPAGGRDGPPRSRTTA